jgi:hypothetical protein
MILISQDPKVAVWREKESIAADAAPENFIRSPFLDQPEVFPMPEIKDPLPFSDIHLPGHRTQVWRNKQKAVENRLNKGRIFPLWSFCPVSFDNEATVAANCLHLIRERQTPIGRSTNVALDKHVPESLILTLNHLVCDKVARWVDAELLNFRELDKIDHLPEKESKGATSLGARPKTTKGLKMAELPLQLQKCVLIGTHHLMEQPRELRPTFINASLAHSEEGYYPGAGPPTPEWVEKTPLGQSLQKRLTALHGGTSYAFFVEYRRHQPSGYLTADEELSEMRRFCYLIRTIFTQQPTSVVIVLAPPPPAAHVDFDGYEVIKREWADLAMRLRATCWAFGLAFVPLGIMHFELETGTIVTGHLYNPVKALFNNSGHPTAEHARRVTGLLRRVAAVVERTIIGRRTWHRAFLSIV